MRKVIRLLQYQTLLSCSGNEFNLELVHFNNSRALIAGLKGFTLFWQQKVFIKFTYLFTLTDSVETCLLSRRDFDEKLALWCRQKSSLGQRGSIYLSILWNHKRSSIIFPEKKRLKKKNACYLDQIGNDINFVDNFFWQWLFFGTEHVFRAASFLSIERDKVTNLKCGQLDVIIKL